MRHLAVLTLLTGSICGCSEPIAPRAYTFTISPHTLELSEGHLAELRVSTTMGDDRMVTPVSWQFLPDAPGGNGASAIGISNVDRRGKIAWVHAWAPTAGRVVASHSGAGSDTAYVTVRGVSVAQVSIEPVTASLEVGEWIDVGVSVVDSAGTGLQRQLVWSSSDPSVATVEYSPDAGFTSGLNRVWAVAPGTVTLTAAADTAAATMAVVVTAAGG